LHYNYVPTSLKALRKRVEKFEEKWSGYPIKNKDKIFFDYTE